MFEDKTIEEVEQLLADYIATVDNPEYGGDMEVINSKFPEFQNVDPQLLEDYIATYNNPEYGGNIEIINSKFPEFFEGLKKKDAGVVTSETEGMESVTPQEGEEVISSDASQVTTTESPEGEVTEDVTLESQTVIPEDEDEEEIEGMETYVSPYATGEGEKNTWIEDFAGKNELTDFFGDIYRSWDAGQAQGGSIDESLELWAKGDNATDEDIEAFLAAQERMQSKGESDEMRDFNKIYQAEDGGWWGFIKGVAANPTVIPQLFTSSVSAMVNPAVLAAGAGGAAVGAGIGSTGFSAGPLGVFTTAGGAIAGGMGAMGATLETGLTFSELLLEELGDKPMTKENVRKVLQDPEAMASIRRKALGRGLTIGAVDAISAGVASKVTAGTIKAVRKGKKVKKLATMAGTAAGGTVEAVGGSTGEVAGRLVAGQEMDVAEIGFEGIAGTATAPLTIGYGIYKANRGPVSKAQIEDILDNGSDEDIAGVNLEIINDPELKQRAADAKENIKTETRLRGEFEEAGITDENDINELLDLEKQKEKLEGATSETAKNRVKQIVDQIEAVIQKGAFRKKAVEETTEQTTEETIETQREEELEEHIDKFFTEDKETGNRVGPNPDTQPELYNEEIKKRDDINKKYDELLTEKKKQDAIQKQSTETLDVQEQTPDGQRVGERDAPVAEVTRESETEIETDTQPPTQEEVAVQEEAKDLQTLLEEQETVPTPEAEVTTQETAVEVDTEAGTVGVTRSDGTKVVLKGSSVAPNVQITEQTTEQTKTGKIGNILVAKAKNAGKAIAKLLPGANIVIHATEKAYNQAVAENAKGSRGAYSGNTNTIHINANKANAKTLTHEVFHAILKNKLKSEVNIQAVTKRMVNAVSKSLKNRPKLKAMLDKYASNFAENLQSEEKLAELVGALADDFTKLDAPTRSLVKRWLDKIAQTFGITTETQSVQDTIDLLNTIAEKVSTGQEVTKKDVKSVKKRKPKKKSKTKKSPDDEMREAYEQREKQLEKEMQGETGLKGPVSYIEQQIHDYFGGITREDFDQFGDRNLRSRALNFLLRKEASPIDAQAMEISEMAGVEITPQDIVDYMVDRVNSPGKYAQAKTQALTGLAKLAADYNMNPRGFMPANIHNLYALKKAAQEFGAEVKAGIIREGYRKGEVAGYYFTKGGRFLNPIAQDKTQAIKGENAKKVTDQKDNVANIIQTARENNFSDAAIKKYLSDVKGLTEAEVTTALEVQTKLLEKIPTTFTAVEGGLAQGLKLFNEVKSELKKFAADKKNSLGDVRAKAMELMQNHEIFQKQPDQIQQELISSFDRTLGTQANPNVQKQISEIRNDIKQRKAGAKNLKAAQTKVKNFIRRTLPASKTYTQAQINKLVSLVSNSTETNFQQQSEKVLQIVDQERAKMKKGALKKILDLVKAKAKKRRLGSKKVRSKGLDAEGQGFFAAVKPILEAAIKQDADTLAAIKNRLDENESVIDEALQKELRGEKLTANEQKLLDEAFAYDTFAEVSAMQVEDVEVLLQGLKDVRTESIKRLSSRRLARAKANERMTSQADKQIQEDYGILYNEDGTLKSENQLRNEKNEIWNNFKKLKIWSGIKQWAARTDFTSTTGIFDWFRNRLFHLGTLTNILDRTHKKNTFFRDSIYRPLNRMNEKAVGGHQSERTKLDALANTIEGVTRGVRQIVGNLATGVHHLTGMPKALSGPYNADQLLRIYALSKNDIQRAKLEKMGIGPTQLAQIEGIVGPEAVQFADKVVDYLSNTYFDSVNSVYSQTNDVNLGYVPNYFPTKTAQTNVDGKLLEDGNFNGIFNEETAPALKERIDRTGEIDLKGNFIEVLDNHFQSMEKYKAFAEGVKKLNSLFKIKSVNTLVEQTGLKSAIKTAINFVVNPNSGPQIPPTLINRAMSKFTSYALAFKLIQIPKQASSFITAFENYSFRGEGKPYIPGMDTLGFMMDTAYLIATLPMQIKKAYGISAEFRNRIKQGLEGDIYGLASGAKTFKPVRKGSGFWAKASQALRTGAAAPTILGDILGVMGYMINYNRNIANGMSKAEALEAFNDYNATQQTRRGTEKIPLQMDQSAISRSFTMFGSTLFLQLNKVSSTFTNVMRALKDGKPPRTQDLRGFILNYSAANMMFMGIANIAKFIEGEDEDREDALDAVRDAGLGLNIIYQIPLLGAAVETMVNKATDSRKPVSDVVNPYINVFRKISKGIDDKSVFRVIQPFIELVLGAQMDPFIALYNGLSGDDIISDKEGFDESNVYDILGISKSYRPKEHIQKPPTAQEMKIYKKENPELYLQLLELYPPEDKKTESMKQREKNLKKENPELYLQLKEQGTLKEHLRKKRKKDEKEWEIF